MSGMVALGILIMLAGTVQAGIHEKRLLEVMLNGR
jgi:hypothetical protein